MSRTAILFLLLAAAPVSAMQAPAADELSNVVRINADAKRGAGLYAPCLHCHLRDGSGTPEGYVPVIAGQHQRVLAKQLIDYRHAERRDLRMEEVTRSHNLRGARDIADLAAYISSMPREKFQGQGDGQHADHGKQVFLRDCASCHGAEAEGNGVLLVPRLAGQHYRYLLRQLHDTIESRRPNMPPPHSQLLENMDVADLTGLADYLSRVQPARRVVR